MREEYFWDAYARIYDFILNRFDPYIEEQRKIFKIIDPIKKDNKGEWLKIVELGSGTSNYGGILAGRGCTLVSLDISKTMLNRAVVKYGKEKIQPVRASLNSFIPLKDNWREYNEFSFIRCEGGYCPDNRDCTEGQSAYERGLAPGDET